MNSRIASNRFIAFSTIGLLLLSGCNKESVELGFIVISGLTSIALNSKKIEAANLDVEAKKLEIKATKQNGDKVSIAQKLNDEQIQKIRETGKAEVQLEDGYTATVPVTVPDAPPSPQPTIPNSTPESNEVPQQTDRPILGVKVASLTEELRHQINQDKSFNQSVDVDKGVLVVEVVDDYPAAKAGIQVGDVIVSVNGETVVDADEFVNEIKKIQASTALPLEIYRGQQKLEVSADIK